MGSPGELITMCYRGRRSFNNAWQMGNENNSKHQVEGYCVVYLSRPGHVCNNKIQTYVRKFANDTVFAKSNFRRSETSPC